MPFYGKETESFLNFFMRIMMIPSPKSAIFRSPPSDLREKDALRREIFLPVDSGPGDSMSGCTSGEAAAVLS